MTKFLGDKKEDPISGLGMLGSRAGSALPEDSPSVSSFSFMEVQHQRIAKLALIGKAETEPQQGQEQENEYNPILVPRKSWGEIPKVVDTQGPLSHKNTLPR